MCSIIVANFAKVFKCLEATRRPAAKSHYKSYIYMCVRAYILDVVKSYCRHNAIYVCIYDTSFKARTFLHTTPSAWVNVAWLWVLHAIAAAAASCRLIKVAFVTCKARCWTIGSTLQVWISKAINPTSFKWKELLDLCVALEPSKASFDSCNHRRQHLMLCFMEKQGLS